MAWNLSTKAKNLLLGDPSTMQLAKTATTLSFEDGTGTGGNDRVADSGSGLVGFNDYAYFTLSVYGSTSNDGDYVIQNAAAGYIEIPAGSLATEAAGDQVILIVSQGGSFKEVFANCVLDLFNGSRPTNADAAENGTQLVRITNGGAAFVSGSPDNGINFGNEASGAIGLATDPTTGSAQSLSGEGLVTGSALSARIYSNTVVTGADTTTARMDGRVGESNSEVNMSAGTTITDGVDADVTSLSLDI